MTPMHLFAQNSPSGLRSLPARELAPAPLSPEQELRAHTSVGAGELGVLGKKFSQGPGVSCRCSGMSTATAKTDAERADEMIAWHRAQSERLVREHIESVRAQWQSPLAAGQSSVDRWHQHRGQ